MSSEHIRNWLYVSFPSINYFPSRSHVHSLQRLLFEFVIRFRVWFLDWVHPIVHGLCDSTFLPHHSRYQVCWSIQIYGARSDKSVRFSSQSTDGWRRHCHRRHRHYVSWSQVRSQFVSDYRRSSSTRIVKPCISIFILSPGSWCPPSSPGSNSSRILEKDEVWYRIFHWDKLSSETKHFHTWHVHTYETSSTQNLNFWTYEWNEQRVSCASYVMTIWT